VLPRVLMPGRPHVRVKVDGRHRLLYIAVEPAVVGLAVVDVGAALPERLAQVVRARVRVLFRQVPEHRIVQAAHVGQRVPCDQQLGMLAVLRG